jgi:3-oxoacyl-[acyl-carrier-protein] synthase-3
MQVFLPAKRGIGIALRGTGAFLPQHIVDNEALAARGAPLSPAEVVRLCGVERRHFVDETQATSDLAVGAARSALEDARLAAVDVSRLVLSTSSPDQLTPSTACRVHGALGLVDAPAVDVNAACSGFLFALDVAARAIATGDEYALVVAADVRSRFVDVRDRATCALFGDGAGAAVLSRGPVGRGLVAIGLLADGRVVDAVGIPAGGSREPASTASVAAGRHTLQMRDGPAVYFAAVEGMAHAARTLLASCGLGPHDVDVYVPHQANRRMLERMMRMLDVPVERAVVCVHETGNMSSASTAVALHRARVSGRLGPGTRALLVAAGAGYTAGAALLHIEDNGGTNA